MLKRGFSIAEFVVSIMFMFLIIGSAISIPMKKAKQTKHNIKQDGVKICSCSNNDDRTKGCAFEFEPTGRFEFYTVQILGGGAAGGPNKGGAAGEAKIVHLPTMAGKYFIRLGEGGQVDSNPHGGNTVLYKVADDGSYQLVEFARGGVSGPVEKINEEALLDPALKSTLEKGEIATFGTDATTSACGAGGNANTQGQAGEVIIKW